MPSRNKERKGRSKYDVRLITSSRVQATGTRDIENMRISRRTATPSIVIMLQFAAAGHALTLYSRVAFPEFATTRCVSASYLRRIRTQLNANSDSNDGMNAQQTHDALSIPMNNNRYRIHLRQKYGGETVKVIKNLLKQRALSCQGLKNDLLDRLVDHEVRQRRIADHPKLSGDDVHPFHAKVEELVAGYMELEVEALQELADEKQVKVARKTKDDIAKAVAIHDILESNEIAKVLCYEKDVRSRSVFFDPGTLPLDFVMASVEHFRAGKLIGRRYVNSLLADSHDYCKALPSLVRIAIPNAAPDHDPKGKPRITVCGDTHGQFYDLLHIFDLNGFPHRNNPYIFNGDFVDRGAFGVELILTLLLFKLYDPDCIHLTRGNHETKWDNCAYGFTSEISKKYPFGGLYDDFLKVFQWLPLAAVVGRKIFVAHGGIPTDETVMLKDIQKMKRGVDPKEPSLMCDLLWSDPREEPGLGRSGRGIDTKRFGPDITAAFLERNKLELLVRSHEVRKDGYSIEHDGKLITVFSAPNYCDHVGNKGAFIHFDKSRKPLFTQFDCVPHP